MSRPRGLLVLFMTTMLLGTANAARQLTANNSAVDLPLGVLSLLVALTSAGAGWGSWTAARWTYRAVLLWGATLLGAAVAGSVLLRPYMPTLWDVMPGPIVIALLVGLTIRSARQRFRAPAA